MGRPKALVQWRGQSFFAHGVRALWSTCDVVIAVLGAHAADVRHDVEREFGRLVEAGDLSRDLHVANRHGSRSLEVQFVTNRAWSRGGMLSSARTGLASALRTRAASILLLPVDHPEVSAETVVHMSAMMAHALQAFGGRRGR
ncbi:MAG TPA: NTP transferase domain-containing protein, partial [Candidatus Acidoferrales bacterium]|nr:NTP transferase domain-containing protein [Candidatus Acidoferrales bacterium]